MKQPPTLESARPKIGAMGGGLSGAENTSRETLRWHAPIISPDRAINAVKDVADARAVDMVNNDGYAIGAMSTHRDSIVGGQYRLNAQPDFEALGATEEWAEEFQRVVESRFNLVADSPRNWLDAAGKNNFTGQIRLAVAMFLTTGEVLATAEWLRASNRPCRTAIQMISPTRLSNPDNRSDEQNLRRGVVTDFYGKAIGYHIRNGHPNDFFDMSTYKWTYVPATKPWGREQVIHIVEQRQPAQTRGIADMVSVLKQMRMTSTFQDVTLQNAVVNATYAAAIESELPKEMIFQSMGAGGDGINQLIKQYLTGLTSYIGQSDNIALDGVKMPHLYPGTKLNMKPAGTPGGVGTGFEESLLRHIATALGLSYEQFTRDYSKTNYSSARASMTETWKFMQARKKMVADRLASIIYCLWLEEEINAGNIPLPAGFTVDDFYDPIKREAFTACDWIGASRGQIDEMKETQAAILRIKSGLSTYEAESARLGLDFRKTFRQRAREEKLMKKLGLVFDMQATKPGANQSVNSMKDKADDEENATRYSHEEEF